MVRPLHFQIDVQSGVPAYRQLMAQVRYYVASGTLRAGDQLPSIRELAQAMTVNPTTIVKAYSELAHDEVIELRHGKGAFVARRSRRASEAECEQALRRLARQLALEASQMGAAASDALRIVREELEALTPAADATPPLRVAVLGRG